MAVEREEEAEEIHDLLLDSFAGYRCACGCPCRGGDLSEEYACVRWMDGRDE